MGELTWVELTRAPSLPDELTVDGVRWARSGAVGEAVLSGEQSLTRESRTSSYPDGTKAKASGRSFVGGRLEWALDGLKPGRELLLVKRVDALRGEAKTWLEVG